MQYAIHEDDAQKMSRHFYDDDMRRAARAKRRRRSIRSALCCRAGAARVYARMAHALPYALREHGSTISAQQDRIENSEYASR